jgi:glycosyltransferase involved in cell wall biosynthesis
MKEYTASVLIPTYNRAHTIGRVLDALTKQTVGDFEVLVVLKKIGDKTEEIVKKYQYSLNLKLIIQTEGYIVNAYNLGLENASGKIIIFLDDDAIPTPNFVKKHLESYKLSNVAGVAGNVITDIPIVGKKVQVQEESSEIIKEENYPTLVDKIGKKLWLRPVTGQENYLIYLSKAGIVADNPQVAILAKEKVTNSLLGKGANMSILSKTIRDFRFPNSWISGFTCEQYLGWHIWKKGYSLVFNPSIKVYHLNEGQSLSRNIRDSRKRNVLCTEGRLLFYMLYGKKQQFSLKCRVVWVIIDAKRDFERIFLNKETSKISLLKIKFFSELVGLTLLLSKSASLEYSPLKYLEKLNNSK